MLLPQLKRGVASATCRTSLDCWVDQWRPSSVTSLRPLEEDCAQHDCSLGDLLDLRGQVELGHQAEDEREREDAQKRPDDRRPPAREAGAADDDCADRVELVEVSADW